MLDVTEARSPIAMKRILFLVCSSALVAAACTQSSGALESAEPPPVGAVVEPDPPLAAEVVCDVLSVTPTADGFASAQFRATNRGQSAIAYRGFGPDSPLYSREVLDEGRWEKDPLGWCGTGLEDQVLHPGKSVVFEIGFDRDGRSYRFTFGDPLVVTPAVTSAPD